MGKAILFRGILITLAAGGCLCFAEGYIIWALWAWVLEAFILYAGFPRIEGIPRERISRLAWDVIPVIFFFGLSGMVLTANKELPGYSWCVLLGVISLQVLAVLGLLKLHGRKRDDRT